MDATGNEGQGTHGPGYARARSPQGAGSVKCESAASPRIQQLATSCIISPFQPCSLKWPAQGHVGRHQNTCRRGALVSSCLHGHMACLRTRRLNTSAACNHRMSAQRDEGAHVHGSCCPQLFHCCPPVTPRRLRLLTKVAARRELKGDALHAHLLQHGAPPVQLALQRSRGCGIVQGAAKALPPATPFMAPRRPMRILCPQPTTCLIAPPPSPAA